MSEGQLKAEKDFSKEVGAELPKAQQLAKVGCNIDGTNIFLMLIRLVDERPSCNREASCPRKESPPGIAPLSCQFNGALISQ